ncbi:PREDICTED: uncharacterized protein LOC103090854 [Lipotes vexillifer]|uniref:Uncharacterized protein LOC103090854 n=1 Tax=Lipotes vexillifer TaxID=118797 RepID=A0A340XU24_LIPVE|nr:PREDICTED: uncharacterized protein LOC103090854 [Lipotes vexillifer]
MAPRAPPCSPWRSQLQDAPGRQAPSGPAHGPPGPQLREREIQAQKGSPRNPNLGEVSSPAQSELAPRSPRRQRTKPGSRSRSLSRSCEDADKAWRLGAAVAAEVVVDVAAAAAGSGATYPAGARPGGAGTERIEPEPGPGPGPGLRPGPEPEPEPGQSWAGGRCLSAPAASSAAVPRCAARRDAYQPAGKRLKLKIKKLVGQPSPQDGSTVQGGRAERLWGALKLRLYRLAQRLDQRGFSQLQDPPPGHPSPRLSAAIDLFICLPAPGQATLSVCLAPSRVSVQHLIPHHSPEAPPGLSAAVPLLSSFRSISSFPDPLLVPRAKQVPTSGRLPEGLSLQHRHDHVVTLEPAAWSGLSDQAPARIWAALTPRAVVEPRRSVGTPDVPITLSFLPSLSGRALATGHCGVVRVDRAQTEERGGLVTQSWEQEREARRQGRKALSWCPGLVHLALAESKQLRDLGAEWAEVYSRRNSAGEVSSVMRGLL